MADKDKTHDDDLKRVALRQLISETIDAAGPLDPSELPHRVKARLEAQVSNEKDLDALIADVLKQRKG